MSLSQVLFLGRLIPFLLRLVSVTSKPKKPRNKPGRVLQSAKHVLIFVWSSTFGIVFLRIIGWVQVELKRKLV